MSEKKVLVLLAPGYEELEAVAVVDILRRAGIKVVIAGITEGPVPSAREVRIVPDVHIDDIRGDEFDLIFLPGGIDGTENLAGDERVMDMLRRQIRANRAIGAICAAPAVVLDRHGLVSGKNITCHPVCQKDVKQAMLSGERVVEDGALITSQAPGTAVELAFRLVEFLAGRDRALEVNKGVLARLD